MLLSIYYCFITPQAFFVRTINENLFFVEGHSVDDILDLANVSNVQMGRIYLPFNEL